MKNENNIKKLRNERLLTQAELSKLSGVSVSNIKMYETLGHDLTKAQLWVIVGLATTLKCSISDLFTDLSFKKKLNKLMKGGKE